MRSLFAMQRLVIGAACAISVSIGLFFCYAVAARYVLHGRVTASSLSESVRYGTSSSMGLLVKDVCHVARARTWRCTLTDLDVGGTATYRVKRRGSSSCWDGDLVTAMTPGPMPEDIAGCVHAWQWEFWDLAGRSPAAD